MEKPFFEKYFKKQPFKDAANYFSLLMHMLIPERLELVIDIIMDFLRREQLWKLECTCCEIFHALLSCRGSPEVVIDKMLSSIEEMMFDDNIKYCEYSVSAIRVVRVLHSITSSEYFASMPNSGMIRLIKLYHLSVAMEDNKFHLIRKGFEMVLINLLRTVSADEVAQLFPMILTLTFKTNLSKFKCKDFGLTLRHGVERLRSHRSLNPEYLDFLLETMTSPDDVESFLATKFLSILIDRHNNIDRFSSCMIFHEYTDYNIHIELEVDDEVKNVLENYQKLLEASIITFIKMHSTKRDNLNAIYSLMCIIVASVPCGFTVTLVVCILMNLQKFLIAETENLSQQQLNHLHSLIASIMTLICWVTRAKSLTKYIHGIVDLRYNSAPHLNPPVHRLYENAEHQVLNRKRELFFNSWELRYCLWKRFRLDEEKLPAVATSTDHDQDFTSSSKKYSKLFQSQKSIQLYKIKLISSQRHPSKK